MRETALYSQISVINCGQWKLLDLQQAKRLVWIVGKFISVNLQKTKHHKKTDIVIHSYIDGVMKGLCDALGVVVPTYSAPRVLLHSQHCLKKGSCLSSKTSIFDGNHFLNIDSKFDDKKTNFDLKPSLNSTDLKRKYDIPNDDMVKKESKFDTWF